jgi:hypothetical protein
MHPLAFSSCCEATADDVLWLAEIAADAIGWQPLGEGAYLHLGRSDEGEAVIITVAGVPAAGMAGLNVLLLG